MPDNLFPSTPVVKDTTPCSPTDPNEMLFGDSELDDGADESEEDV